MSFFKIKVVLFFLFVNICTYSQTEKYKIEYTIDSSFIELKKEKNTLEKVDNLIKLFKLSAKNEVYSYDVIDEAIKIANDLYYLDGMAIAYSRKAIALRYQQKYYDAIQNHKLALVYFKNTIDTLSHIKCLNSLATTYRKLNLEEDAFKYYLKSFNLAKSIKNERSQAIALNGIGNIFVDIKKYSEALPYFRKALAFEIKNKNYRGIEYDYSSIGEIFLNINQFDSALFYINSALDIAKKRNKPNKTGMEYSLLGLLYQKQGDFIKSSEYYHIASSLFLKEKNSRYLSNTFINIGINKINLNKTDEALPLIHKGIEYARKVNSKENLILGNHALIKYFIKKELYKQAFDKQSKYIELKDSILNDIAIQSIMSSKIAYETLEKDQKIKTLAKETKKNKEQAERNLKTMVLIMIASIILILLMGAIFYLYRKSTRLELENMENQLKKYIKKLNKEDLSFEEKIAKFNFSNREADVLELMMKGISNNDIAEQLFISVNTVKTHIKNIYLKLDAKNRIQAIKKVNSSKNT